MKSKITKIIAALIALVVTVLCVGYFLGHFLLSVTWNMVYTGENIFTVNGKDRSGDYEIYTDHGTFRNEDSLIFLKFDSSDVQSDLVIGKKYNCSTQGFRIVWYRTRYMKNILSCNEIK